MEPIYRVAVVADIHGNLTALDAVLDDLKDTRLDALIAAGDLIVGPEQGGVLDRLIEAQQEVAFGAVMIQGNNEQAVARIAAGSAPEYVYTSKQYRLRRWALEQLSAEQLALVRGLPEQRVLALPGADPIRISHGSPRNISELVIPASRAEMLDRFMFVSVGPHTLSPEEIFGLAVEPVQVFGHTHLPWREQRNGGGGGTASGSFNAAERGGHLAFNPGAVNYPMDGFVGAQYAILTWSGGTASGCGTAGGSHSAAERGGGTASGSRKWSVEHRAVKYDLNAARRVHEESGFLDTGVLARIFLEELLTGKVIAPDLFKIAWQMMAESGRADLAYVPDDIWEEAGESVLSNL